LNTIYLQTSSWITDTLGVRGSTFYTFEKKVEAGTTLLKLFSDLARDYPEFKKLVFNPDSGKISDQVLLLMNQNLSRFEQVRTLSLNDKDAISLIPIIFGG